MNAIRMRQNPNKGRRSGKQSSQQQLSTWIQKDDPEKLALHNPEGVLQSQRETGQTVPLIDGGMTGIVQIACQVVLTANGS